MAETVTFKGSPLTLAGHKVRVGGLAPRFTVTAQDLSSVTLDSFSGKIKVLTTFPSLDTPVCDLQVKEFNRRAASLGQDVAIVGISMDLPFAQKRFCSEHDIRAVTVVSDYATRSFGLHYGLLIRELGLLARAVLIVDRADIVRYLQVVEEVTHAPDYDAALEFLQKVQADPGKASNREAVLKCVACEGPAQALDPQKAGELAAAAPGWELVEGKKLVKEFVRSDFADAKVLLDMIALAAQEQGHHPTLTISWNKVKVTLTTHAAKGLSMNDFIMASIIDGLAQ